MMDRKGLEEIFRKKDDHDFARVKGSDVVGRQWVRFKCEFGGPSYGRSATCPPNNPPVAECRKLFDEYDHAAIFHFHAKGEKAEARKIRSKKINMKILKLELDVFTTARKCGLPIEVLKETSETMNRYAFSLVD